MQKWLHVISDVILHVNMAPLTAEDRLLIKTLRIENGSAVDKMIVEFQGRQWIIKFGDDKNVDNLKKVLISCWDVISQELISGATY